MNLMRSQSGCMFFSKLSVTIFRIPRYLEDASKTSFFKMSLKTKYCYAEGFFNSFSTRLYEDKCLLGIF